MPPLIEVEDRRRGDEEEVGGDVSRCSFKMAAKIKSLPSAFEIRKIYWSSIG